MKDLLDTRPLLDEQLDAVAHVERRQLLVALVDESPRGETSIKIDETRGVGETQDALVAMQHNHLPKLEGLGFIRWEQEHDRVIPGPQFGEIEPLLEMILELPDAIPANRVETEQR